MMTQREDARGIAIICDLEGEIQEVLRDDFGLFVQAKSNLPLVKLADSSEARKIINFLDELRTSGWVMDWEINLPHPPEYITLKFSGVHNGERLLLVATKSRHELADFVDDLSPLNHKLLIYLQAKIKEKFDIDQNRVNLESHHFDELSRLNNELVTLQRQFAQKNAQLRESEKRFKALFQGIPVPVYTWRQRGDDFVLVDNNLAADAITGGGVRKFLGKTAAAMYPDRLDIVEDISRCFVEQVSFQREMEYQFKATEETKILMVKYAFVPPDLVLVHTDDITQRVLAEQALKDIEGRLELAVAGSGGGLWHIDLDPDDPSGKPPDKIWLSPRLKSMIGYQDEELPNTLTAWENLIMPEDLSRLRKISKKFRQGQIDHYGLEYRIRHKDGGIRWLRTSGRVERDSDGGPILFAGIDWDVTARVQAEKALHYQAKLLESVSDAVITTDLEFRIQSWNEAAENLYGWRASEVLGKIIDAVIPTEYPDDSYDEVFTKFQAAGVWHGEVIQKHKEGHEIHVHASVNLVSAEDGKPMSVMAINRDITEIKMVESSLRQRVEQLSTLHEVAKALTTVTNLSDTLGVVAQNLCDLFDARSAIYLIPGSDEDQLRILAGFERESGTFATTNLKFPLNEMPITRRVMTEAQSFVVPDIQSVPLPEPNITLAREMNLQALLLTPLLGRGQILGLQVLALDEPERVFTDDDVSLAEIFATDVAAALDNALLTELSQAAAVEEERQRLARELHDSVTQTLFLSASLAETLPRVWEKDPERARQAMADLRHLTQGALAEMRSMLLELRPEALAEQRLERLLRQLTDGMMARTKMDVITTIEGDCPIPNDVKIGLYRITQEALTNIAKHAQAKRSIINLFCEPKQVVLCIRDDGIGFDPESKKLGSMGLNIMRERSQTIGASFELKSEPGNGTEITVTWVDNSNTNRRSLI